MSALSISRHDDFTGGLNLRADQFQLRQNESPDMLNVEIDPRGGVFSRGGMHRLNTTAVSGTWSPHRLYPFYGDAARLMLSNGANVLWSSGGDFTRLDYSSGNAVTATSADGASLSGWGDTLYIATGATSGSVGYKWKTGDTYATALTSSGPTWQAYASPTGTHMPIAEIVATHNNKLFVANTFEDGTAYPNRLRWSHEGLPENWMADDYIDFTGGGLGIRGLAVVAGHLVVFKPNNIYLLVGNSSDNFQVVELSANLGANSRLSVANSESGVFFYSNPEGLFLYDGTGIKDVFQPLRPLVDNKLLSASYTKPYSVSWLGRRMWVGLPYDQDGVTTKPTRNFLFDPSIGDGAYTQFTTHDSCGVVGGCDWTDDGGANFRVACHPTSAYVLKVDLYDEEKDNTTGTLTAFASYYRTGWVDGGVYAQKKVFRRPDIVFKQVDTQRLVNVKVFHNYEEASGSERKQFDISLGGTGTGGYWGTAYWGSGLWGVASEGASVKEGRNLGLARSVQLLLTGPSTGEWGIDSITYKYNNRKVRS
ncbi:MAG: stabilization protein [Podoviridae sp. ctDWo9]|nr:MAG: stabilization protein [Podoviridae sp. ctDWo9]